MLKYIKWRATMHQIRPRLISVKLSSGDISVVGDWALCGDISVVGDWALCGDISVVGDWGLCEICL